MPDMKVFLELIAKSDKFQQGMQQGERALKGFQGYAQKTGQFVSDLTQKFGFLGKAAAAISSGLVFKKLLSISDYMPIDDSLLRMRVNLKATGAEMDIFKNKIASLSGKTGLDIGEAFQGANKLSLIFPKQDEILQVMKTSERVAKTMKVPYDVVQDRITGIMKICRLGVKDVERIGDELITAQVNMESFDTVTQRLALHGGAKKSLTEELGMLNGLRIAGMNNPRVILQLNNVLNAIDDHQDVLKAVGIKVQGRSEIEVLKDLEIYMTKWRKRMSSQKFDEATNKFFGPNGRQDLDFIFSQLENFKKGIEEMARARQIAAERHAAAEAAWENQLNRIKSQLGGIKTDLSFIYDLAKKPVKLFADHPAATKTAGYTALVASGGVLAALGYGGIKKILGGAGKTGLGIAKGKILEEATGVTPVFVTNMPAGGLLPGNDSKLGWIKNFMLGSAVTATTIGTAILARHYLQNGGSPINLGAALHGMPEMDIDEYRYPKEEDKMPMIYNDEYKRNGDKNNFVFNFKFDKNGRVTGDTNTADADFIINIARGDFGF